MAFKIIGAGLSPFVRKARIFFAEKGVPYEHEPLVPFGVSAEYKRKSPLGRIPCLEHDGRALPDSSVICAYLEKLQPEPALWRNGWPPSPGPLPTASCLLIRRSPMNGTRGRQTSRVDRRRPARRDGQGPWHDARDAHVSDVADLGAAFINPFEHDA